MSFIPQNSTREVPPEGNPNAKICIIGEAPAREEIKEGRPFVGAAGSVLEQCLHSSGLIRADLYITNVFKRMVSKSGDKYYIDKKCVFSPAGFTDLGQEWVERLRAELACTGCNVYVPMGNPALCALVGIHGITDRRGYIYESTLLPGRKTIPAIHPAAALRGNFLWRYYTAHDLQKAKAQSTFPEIRYPDPTLYTTYGYYDTLDYLAKMLQAKRVSCDIEVLQHEVSCISFTDCRDYAISIPIDDRWTIPEEMEIWRAIARVLESPTIVKVGQNFIFDAQFLTFKMGIQTKLWHNGKSLLDDTMVAHSIIYPDFEKSLRFLASTYTDFPYWKDMVKWKGGQAKKES